MKYSKAYIWLRFQPPKKWCSGSENKICLDNVLWNICIIRGRVDEFEDKDSKYVCLRC